MLLSLNCEYILADDFSYQLMSLGVVVSLCLKQVVQKSDVSDIVPQFIFIYLLSIFPLCNLDK